MRCEHVRVTDDVTLVVRRHDGDGRPFLLVHGLASNARLWDGVADHLAAAGHAVVAVDLRGHGQSSKPNHGYDFATVVADLVAVIDAVDLDRPIVAGQSWGGNVVLELAARHPGRAHAVALVDGGWIHLGDRFDEWAECEAVMRPPPLAGTKYTRIVAAIRSARPDWPESGIAGSLANFEVLEDGTVRPWLSLENHLRILRALWEHQPRQLYASVPLPVLLIPAGGSADDPAEAAKRANVAEALAMLAAARVRWYEPPADHDLHAQHPEAIARDLLGLV
jgi:pimeloyl-ACP methyl ester carboxylesterase